MEFDLDGMFRIDAGSRLGSSLLFLIWADRGSDSMGSE